VTYLATFDGLSGQHDAVVDFGGDAEVLEEALVGGPELPPHVLAPRAASRVDQVCRLLEHPSRFHPLQHKNIKSNQVKSTIFYSKTWEIILLQVNKHILNHNHGLF
jgi:hypothetical protein